jgi:GR25 family glycosyltransferase involved in LPS biosynthesis
MNVLNKYFDKIYVITAKQHQNRICYIKKLFKNENIIFDFHYAVDVDYLNKQILKDYVEYIESINNSPVVPPSMYCISATISHLQILNSFKYSDYSNVLIFEDDVYFADNYQEKLELFINNVPNDWDILNLGQNYTFKQNQVSFLSEHVNILKNMYGVHSYAFSKNKINHFCNKFNNTIYLPYALDSLLIQSYQTDYKAYAPSNFLIGALSEHNQDKNFIKTNECFPSLIS